MKVTFLGTRGNIPIRSPKHRWHSALLLSRRSGRVLVDCGEDWLGRAGRLRPTAILLTHGHPDHAGGLKHGAPCPVYATADSWRMIAHWPIEARHEIVAHRPISIAGFVIEPRPVQHSLNAPAVGFRIAASAPMFYVPDVAAIDPDERTLSDVTLYIGDGAALERGILRTRGGLPIGHASVITQLDWCRAAGIRRAVFTHCGSAIVRGSERLIERRVRDAGRARGIDARLAYDGLVLSLRNC